MCRGENIADINQKQRGYISASGRMSCHGRKDIEVVKKTVLIVVSWIAASLTAIAIALIVPGTPPEGKSVHFEGYVPLPGHSMLTVLDYLTVSGRSLFVTNESTGDVYNVALRDRSLPVRADVSVFAEEPAAHGVVIDPSSRLAYVTRSSADAVDIFDPRTMKFFKRIPVAGGADALVYDPLNKLFYAAGADSSVATLIDPEELSTVATIPLGGRPEFVVFDPRSGLLYQNLEDTDSVVVLDLAKRAVVDHWNVRPCRAPSGMAIDELQRRLFIGCRDNALLTVVDIGTHRVIATIPIGKGVDSVAFDPQLHRIYTTGRSGVLVVIQQSSADSYRVLDTMSLHYGAHTLTVDPITHSLYVGYASLGVEPRIAVFTARTIPSS
jgi:DNA-binding beta-propeller fold protein YncE